jgi:uncharacterized membrane protein YjgN (DUF898 family)
MDQYSEPSSEQNQEHSLFGFGIDQTSKAHLWEAAKWARFLAIIGFIMCGIIAIIGIFAGSIFSTFSSKYDDYGGASAFGSGMAVVMIVMYVGIAVIYFFPCLFLLRFANHMKNALSTNDQITLNTSFQNLKIMFRYVGIVTIIIISFYILFILFAILTAMSTM